MTMKMIILHYDRNKIALIPNISTVIFNNHYIKRERQIKPAKLSLLLFDERLECAANTGKPETSEKSDNKATILLFKNI